MQIRVDPDGAIALEQKLLALFRRRLQQHLILVIVLEPVGVLAITPVGGAAGRLHIGCLPRCVAQRPQRGVRGERARTDLDVVGLKDGAPLGRPEAMEGQDQILKRQGFAGRARGRRVHGT